MTTPLGLLFLVKIIVTLLGAALPLLLAPTDRLARLARLPDAGPLFRLYGVAILALLVGYGFGLREVMAGTLPVGVLCVAAVSNLGAGWILIRQTRGILRLSAGFFVIVGIGAVLALVVPELMLGQAA